MWEQIRDANWRVPYTGGWCLAYVQDAFGTDHQDPTAIKEWNDNYGGGNHPGELPPEGVTVPVYFALGDVEAGHIAIKLDDGWIASSTMPGDHPAGYLHPNLQAMIDMYAQYNGGCTYLGWSEYVCTTRVVEWHSNDPVVVDTPAPVVEPPVSVIGTTITNQPVVDTTPVTEPVVTPDVTDTSAPDITLSTPVSVVSTATPIYNDPEPYLTEHEKLTGVIPSQKPKNSDVISNKTTNHELTSPKYDVNTTQTRQAGNLWQFILNVILTFLRRKK